MPAKAQAAIIATAMQMAIVMITSSLLSSSLLELEDDSEVVSSLSVSSPETPEYDMSSSDSGHSRLFVRST
eukprot:CAMPEP_0182579178 /NCGR_PEP_ID=MMETSP1324-20130603/43481_1 /TAXON_ID=236786 /ORGANISM="Florenciella sp., Strain RCC1587" /LENGTH=70 /DNA_ID=CAMNT_0024795243 /DNA_START=11 /DNA_END=220 /DNA_ORIENTATION=+